jgi:transcriptional regulator with XRE-family HTH domain
MEEYELFRKTLKEGLEKARYSGRQLSIDIGVDPSYINLVLTGKRNPPSKAIVEKIANILKIDSDKLLIEAGYTPGFLSAKAPLSQEDLNAIKQFISEIKTKKKKNP